MTTIFVLSLTGFFAACMILATIALTLKTIQLTKPILDGLIDTLDKLRQVLKTSALDFVQVRAGNAQAEVDAQRGISELESQTEADNIKLAALRESERLKPMLLSLRVTEALQRGQPAQSEAKQ